MSIQLRLILLTASFICFFFIIRKIRKAKIRIDDAIFWILSSILFIVMALLPAIPIQLSQLMGIESPANFVFLLAFGLIFIKLFMLSMAISLELEKRTRLVQNIALKEKNLDIEKEI